MRSSSFILGSKKQIRYFLPTSVRFEHHLTPSCSPRWNPKCFPHPLFLLVTVLLRSEFCLSLSTYWCLILLRLEFCLSMFTYWCLILLRSEFFLSMCTYWCLILVVLVHAYLFLAIVPSIILA
jgi:hypothetical protein